MKHDIHKEGLEQLRVISDKYAYKVYNDRWKDLTDGHELEVTWTKSRIFDQFLETDAPGQSKEEKYAVELGPPGADDIDFRDENDELLADMGDDLDDLIGDFSGI